jgi:ORF6N domain
MEIIQNLQNRIYEIRGQRVILDKDIAQLYEIETKLLNQSVKRHIERFPEDFMFQLTTKELENIQIQNKVNNITPNLRSQFVTSRFNYLPLL